MSPQSIPDGAAVDLTAGAHRFGQIPGVRAPGGAQREIPGDEPGHFASLRRFAVGHWIGAGECGVEGGLGDPGEVEMIAVGFLNGQQNPQMFVQDLDRVGTFFDAEKIRWKIRHIWQTEIIDYRGFAGAIVAGVESAADGAWAVI